MAGLAFIFINFKQAARFGHIGWGFSLPDDLFCYGSTDHLWRHQWWDIPGWCRYMRVPPEGDNDWWIEVGNEEQMLATMRSGHHIRYHAYKSIPVAEPQPDRAKATAAMLRSAGWAIAGNNCINQTYRVMSDYGAGRSIPAPYDAPHYLIPRRWFDAIPFQRQPL